MHDHTAPRNACVVRKSQGPPRYRIRIRGVLSDTLLTAFPDLASHTQAGDTVLVGTLPDQSALYGVIAEVEALGLELLEVCRV